MLQFLLAEALNIANQMCQYGYFFPVSDSKNLVVKDDSSLYRFQVSISENNPKNTDTKHKSYWTDSRMCLFWFGSWRTCILENWH